MTDKDDRPLVTFALFSFNQERFIGEAVEGALSQSYEPLQIILSDDCSTDSTFSKMSKIVASYSGPHNVKLIRNETNLGVCAHVNAVIRRAKGALIICAAGDDVSAETRVESVVDAWRESGASAIYSESLIIDAESNVTGEWHLPHNSSNVVIRDKLHRIVFYGAAAAYDKKIFDRFGSLPLDIRNEDYNLAFRAALRSGLTYINTPLVRYREHEQNLSFRVKIQRARAIRSTWSIKAEMHGYTVRNQHHVLGYIRSEFGKRSRLYKEYRIHMLSNVLRFKLYRKMGSANSETRFTSPINFGPRDYYRLIWSYIKKTPTIVRERVFRRALP